MLNPIELNALSTQDRAVGDAELPLPWHQSRSPSAVNIGNINIRGAWENNAVGVPRPVAFVPTHVHPRMAAQRSRFTVWGLDKRSLHGLVPDTILRRFVLDSSQRESFQRDLRMLGVQEASVFPDLDGLARELTELYAVPDPGEPAV
jgi:hypothetical protein